MLVRTRIKVCGITTAEDALDAVAAGVDALGFNFFKGSSRYVPPEKAAEICKLLPAFVSVVGLFVNASCKEISRVVASTKLGLLQFHGDETAGFCESVGHPYVKAVKATSRRQIEMDASAYKSAQAILIDTANNNQFGGTGELFDWSIFPKLNRPLILAGGLNPENVGAAIGATNPYAVDVSSGVERTLGHKDYVKMKCFVDAVSSADRKKNE